MVMFTTTAKTYPINPENRTEEIGIYFTRGGEITLDQYIGEMFKMLHIGVGGDVLVQNIDGDIMPFYGVSDGTWIPVFGVRVVSSATINGNPQSTTALRISWGGGV